VPILDSLARYYNLGLLVARRLLALVFEASAYDKFKAPPCAALAVGRAAQNF
jgi:hypothetical protein